jgi:exodeoxyribonuclease-3
MLRIISLNLNGIRSAATKGLFDWLATTNADIVCLQELKAQMCDLNPQMLAPGGYQGWFHCAEKKGYSGVGIYSRIPPTRVSEGIGNVEFDAEGRYLRADFDTSRQKLSVIFPLPAVGLQFARTADGQVSLHGPVLPPAQGFARRGP